MKSPPATGWGSRSDMAGRGWTDVRGWRALQGLVGQKGRPEKLKSRQGCGRLGRSPDRANLASFKGLQYRVAKFSPCESETSTRPGSQPQGLVGSRGIDRGKHQDHRTTACWRWT